MGYDKCQKILFCGHRLSQKREIYNQYPINKINFFWLENIPFTKNHNLSNINTKKYDNSQNVNRILIVDDEVDLARLFKIVLENEGFAVDVFNDPTKALSCYRSGYYDLLLLDVRMPHMSGFELYEKIKNNGDDTNVCFITAFEEYYDEFRKSFPSLKEVDCFIEKPIGINNLVKIIKKRLNVI